MTTDEQPPPARPRFLRKHRTLVITGSVAVVAVAVLLVVLNTRSGKAPAASGAPGASEQPSWVAPAESGPASASAAPSASAPAGPTSTGAGFPANARFDYQIGGGYAPPGGVAVVIRDSTDVPARVGYNICYVNGFQAQPGGAGQEGTSNWYVQRHPELLLRNPTPDVPTNPEDPNSKQFYVDPDWNGEIILDITKPANLDPLAEIVGRRIAECKRKGFDAIEFDNLDVDSRALARRSDRAAIAGGEEIDTWEVPKLITRAQILAYAKRLIDRTHALGLKAGQKNALELGGAGKAAGFDFAIAESCGEWDECDGYRTVWGSKWVDVEYDAGAFGKACGAVGSSISVILRDVEVTAPGSGTYVYKEC